MDAPSERKITDYGRNIYNDSYDKFTGLFRYTGEGQRGPQKFQRGNKLLKDAKRNDTKIHFFMQPWPGSSTRHIGIVEVIGYKEDLIQADAEGINRTTILFYLRPEFNSPVNQEEDIYREIESEFNNYITLTPGEIQTKILELDNKLRERGLKIVTRIQRVKNEVIRFKTIVKYLKALYEGRMPNM